MSRLGTIASAVLTKYFNPTVGTISTPDTPDMSIDGTVRLSTSLRLDAVAGGFPTLMVKQGPGGTVARELMMFLSGATAYGSATDTTLTQVPSLQINTTPLTLGATYALGVEMTPRSTAVAGIVDGVRRTFASALPLALLDTTAAILIGGPTSGYAARIYWAQMEAINRAQLVFPGVIGNYLSVPNAANLNVAGDIEFVFRASAASWTAAANQILLSKTQGAGNRSWYVFLNSGFLWFNASPDGSLNASAQSTALGQVDGQMAWLKVTRVMSSGLVSFYSAPDQPSEPTTWTARGTSTLYAGQALASSACSVYVGQQVNSTSPHNGRIARLIVRNGIAGTTVLDVSENNAGTMATGTTFLATSGQTVTVAQTAGNTIVQPQADSLVWRFDAADAPFTGTSYTDPRGRTWAMPAGAIVGI